MLVYAGDTAVIIGTREVSLDSATYSGIPAWLIVETRSGMVAAAESLFVSTGLRPLHWSATEGVSRLGAEFVGDSIYAATSGPTGRQNIIMAGRSDLLVSTSMTEVVFGLLPLGIGFRDSLAVLDIRLTASTWVVGEVDVVGEEEIVVDGVLRPCWVVALRVSDRQALFWVDKTDGATLRLLQMLPQHTGRQLEYRVQEETPHEP
jgi:hypothetical protein